MAQEYRWTVKITLEWLDDDGNVEDTTTEHKGYTNERTARARYEAAADTMARNSGRKFQRIAAVELARQPIGAWETVAKA